MKFYDSLNILRQAGYKVEKINEASYATFGKRGQHRWSGHTFARPNEKRSYIRIMRYLREVGDATKRELLTATGYEARPGMLSSLFTAMADEGLITYDPNERTWSLTDYGNEYLDKYTASLTAKDLENESVDWDEVNQFAE